MIVYEDAIDELFALFYESWKTDTTAIVGYIPEVRWQGVEEPDKPDYDKYWCRVSQQTVNESQSTLRNGECGQRYRTEGLIFVQIFAPLSDSKRMSNIRQLGRIARDSFRGKTTSGHIWFRNARVRELTPETKWERLNVVAEYEYDEQG